MTDKTLNVFEIERFAIHDGPGIRTTVFLKGCTLRCAWCANPESQAFKPELLWLHKKCTGCGRCANACPNGVASMQDGAPVFDRAVCLACGVCARACLSGALRIAGQRMTVDEIVAVLLRDKSYYEHSGGGVTVSGGEPFAQHDGLLALLDACGRAGLHTAVETCGDVEPSLFVESFGLVDLYLFDLKHADTETLRARTGGDLGRMLKNLEAATSRGASVIARVPVIPGFNFDEESIAAILDMAAEHGVPCVHLLPYHALGEGKYAAAGKQAPMPHVPSLTTQELEPFLALAELRGLIVKIGG